MDVANSSLSVVLQMYSRGPGGGSAYALVEAETAITRPEIRTPLRLTTFDSEVWEPIELFMDSPFGLFNESWRLQLTRLSGKHAGV
jgi:hypothetical protein